MSRAASHPRPDRRRPDPGEGWDQGLVRLYAGWHTQATRQDAGMTDEGTSSRDEVSGASACEGRTFEGSWPAIPDAVAALRHAVVEHARGAGVPEDALARVRLAVSEAATNVVLHAYADEPEPGPVHVRIIREDHALRIIVRDDGRGMKPRPDSPGLGLGLPLIAQLAASLEVESPPQGGTEICMRFTLV